MKTRLLPVVFFACCWVTAFPSIAHEFWIAPSAYQLDSEEQIIADLVNGQNFKGSRLPFFENRTKRFELISNDTVTSYVGRMGDMPALSTDGQPEGLLTLLHETMPETLLYKTWDKFEAFARHKDFANIRERHADRNLPFAEFTERYSRHAKSLISVGSGKGTDRAWGMETEFVALANPYLLAGDQLPVQLLYQGTPRADAQVEVFSRSGDETVTVSLLRTDSMGHVSIPVVSGHTYLLDAVVLRPSDPETGAVWETLWAALTFAIP